VKRSSSAAGKRAASTGGIRSADLARQNTVAVKVSSHQRRQRATVRRATPRAAQSLPNRPSVSPSRIAEINVTVTAR
jgi:hypothetical protein